MEPDAVEYDGFGAGLGSVDPSGRVLPWHGTSVSLGVSEHKPTHPLSFEKIG